MYVPIVYLCGHQAIGRPRTNHHGSSRGIIIRYLLHHCHNNQQQTNREMGCTGSKDNTQNAAPDKLQFNAADLEDIDQSTHKKKKNVAVPITPVVVKDADTQNNPVADSSASENTAPATVSESTIVPNVIPDQQ